MAFAMLPSAWLVERDAHGNVLLDAEGERSYRLAQLTWRDFRMTGIAALLLLFTLAVKLNHRNAAVGFDRDRRTSMVDIRYTELQRILRVAPATITRAITLLEVWNAIKVHKYGRTSIYELPGVDTDGAWCKYPQDWIEKKGDPVSRFAGLPPTQVGLNALKLYVLLLARRDNDKGYTAFSFDGITKWTGIRREDIRKAWGFLAGQQLVTIMDVVDDRHHEDPSQRYALYGLTPGYRARDIENIRNAQTQAVIGPTDYAKHFEP